MILFKGKIAYYIFTQNGMCMQSNRTEKRQELIIIRERMECERMD